MCCNIDWFVWQVTEMYLMLQNVYDIVANADTPADRQTQNQ